MPKSSHKSQLPEREAIGARIKKLRMDKSVSQVALAYAIGVSTQQVQKYENGTNNITVISMKMIAEVLGCDPCLICGCCDGVIGGNHDQPNA